MPYEQQGTKLVWVKPASTRCGKCDSCKKDTDDLKAAADYENGPETTYDDLCPTCYEARKAYHARIDEQDKQLDRAHRLSHG